MSIQNPYSLLNRTYEVGLAEISYREKIGLLAYSPLGFGMLTGKYQEAYPENSRLGLYGDWFTMGMLLSVPMFLIGLFIIIFSETTLKFIQNTFLSNIKIIIIPIIIFTILYLLIFLKTQKMVNFKK